MTSLFSEEFLSAFASGVSEKVAQNDDAASTASGTSSDPASLPSSPEMSEGAVAPLSSSPAKISGSFMTSSLVAPESLKDLPSLGSLGHFAGLCSRCCFHGKGRCQNGYECRFCHFDHEKRQRKKKIDRNAHGLPAAPVHRQLENQGFHNDAWGMSVAPSPQYVSSPPGLELSSPPPPPLGYPVVSLPAPVPPPTAPPALPAPAVLGQIGQPIVEAPLCEACVEVPATGPLGSMPASSVEDWSVEKVMEWLTSAGLGHLSQKFEEHRITGDVLRELSSSDLEEIGIRALGDKKRLLRAVANLGAPATPAFCPPPTTPPPCFQSPYMATTSPSWVAHA